MVEKIIVSPESIRGLGNIVMPKTGADFTEYNCTMEVGADTVNGEDVTVYVLTPETTTISLVLSSSVNNCYIGDNVVLSVTVTEGSVPVSGESVSFKLGNTEIGTGTTNSSGVATYTYTTTDVGSLNFTSVYAGHSSNSVSVVVSHDYSIAFSQSSYPATSGSATLELTLLDNNVPVEGATITVEGSDSSLYTGITNSLGIASVTVSNISSETTFTASYQGASATCTVTGSSVIYQPALDGTETKKQITGTTTISNGVMTCGASYLTLGWDNTINWKLTFEAKITNDMSAVAIYNPNDTQRDKNQIKISGNYHKNITSYTNGSAESSKTTSVPVDTWFAIECVKNGNSLTATWNNNSYTITWTQLTTLSKVCIGVDTWGNCASIRNIKVEAL